jgi:hypothetical protein
LGAGSLKHAAQMLNDRRVFDIGKNLTLKRMSTVL